MLDRSGFSGDVIEIENLIKGDLIPVNVDGGYSNDLMVVEHVSISETETVIDGFLIWSNRHRSILSPAFTKVEVWNS